MPSDFVMVAIMGAAAMEPALAAIARGVIVALANKECVVAAGAVFHDALERSGASVIPVDSEHNAIFQVLGSGDASEVEMVTHHRFRRAVPRLAAGKDARRHGGSRRSPIPNWAMGAQDFTRQRHLDEQGAGTDRGAFSVRAAARETGCRGASPVDRPLPGQL